MPNKIDWSKAPVGATHYTPEDSGNFACWWKPDGFGWVYKVKDRSVVWQNGETPTNKAVPRPLEKPTFTQDMADAGELPEVGSEYLSRGVKFKSMCYGYNQNYKQVCVGKDENGCLEYHLRSMIKPIDTRTDEEKAKDALVNDIKQELVSGHATAEALVDKIMFNMFNHDFFWQNPSDKSKEKDTDSICQKVGAETERDKEIVRDTLKESKPKDTSCSYQHTVISDFPFSAFGEIVLSNFQKK